MARSVWLLALSLCCLGCTRPNSTAPAAEGKKVEETIQPATAADRARISDHGAAVLKLLRARYGDVQLHQNVGDLKLLQRLSDDGDLRPGQEALLESVGIVFGQVLAGETPLQWITVEWQGKRILALQYPNTTVIVFPGSMVSKRVERGERVEFTSFFRSVVSQVERMKDDPEYKR
jgi:hypothetical protein